MILRLLNLKKIISSKRDKFRSADRIVCDVAPFDRREGIYIGEEYVFCEQEVFNQLSDAGNNIENMACRLSISNIKEVDSNYLSKLGISEQRVGVARVLKNLPTELWCEFFLSNEQFNKLFAELQNSYVESIILEIDPENEDDNFKRDFTEFQKWRYDSSIPSITLSFRDISFTLVSKLKA